jgi:TetR/AcrR family transcriptional regulator, transcriptional repressor for nem operon
MTAVPSTDRGRATHARILDAACVLFHRQGVTATGLDQVAAASGTGKGQLYHYFPDKRALVLAVIDRQIATILDVQQPLLAEVGTHRQLRAWADALVESYRVNDDPVRCPLGALASELAERDPDARIALERGFDLWLVALETALRRLRSNGELSRDVKPKAIAGALLAAYQGGLLLAQVRGDLAPLHTALDVVLRACRP